MSDTSDHLPLDPDELASSYLDGELSDDQRALVEADPGVLALVERHRRVRDALADPVEPLPAAPREAMLAAALAALPEAGDLVGAAAGAAAAGAGSAVRSGAGGATVVPIDRARRARRHRLIAGGLAAAAAVAVIGLVVVRPGGGDGGSQATRDKGATAAESAAGTVAAATDSGASAGTAAGDAVGGAATESSSSLAAAAAVAPPAPQSSSAPDRSSVTSAPVTASSNLAATSLPDLGPLADRPALIAAARPFATTVPAAGAGPCAGYPPPLATATFQGTPAYLVVIEQSATGNRVALLATGTCAVLVKADLAEG